MYVDKKLIFVAEKQARKLVLGNDFHGKIGPPLRNAPIPKIPLDYLFARECEQM